MDRDPYGGSDDALETDLLWARCRLFRDDGMQQLRQQHQLRLRWPLVVLLDAFRCGSTGLQHHRID